MQLAARPWIQGLSGEPLRGRGFSESGQTQPRRLSEQLCSHSREGSAGIQTRPAGPTHLEPHQRAMPLLLLRPEPPAQLPLPAPASLPAATSAGLQPGDEEAPLLQQCREQPPLTPPPEHAAAATQPGLHMPRLRRLEGLALLLVTALMWGKLGVQAIMLLSLLAHASKQSASPVCTAVSSVHHSPAFLHPYPRHLCTLPAPDLQPARPALPSRSGCRPRLPAASCPAGCPAGLAVPSQPPDRWGGSSCSCLHCCTQTGALSFRWCRLSRPNSSSSSSTAARWARGCGMPRSPSSFAAQGLASSRQHDSKHQPCRHCLHSHCALGACTPRQRCRAGSRGACRGRAALAAAAEPVAGAPPCCAGSI